MPYMFDITAKEIENLSPEPFADVINRLLRAESNRIGLSPLNVQTSLNIYEPDGGADAVIKQAPANSKWLPEGLSVWQFKSGEKSHSPTDLKVEFAKQEVQEALIQGGNYCIALGKELSKTARKNREQALRECCVAAQIPVERCHILDASQIAQWASEHLAITLLPYFTRPTGDWMRWDKWKNTGNFKQDYVPDQQRQDIMAFALEALRGQNDLLHVRVEGQAGVGKTRLALQLFEPQNQGTSHVDGFSERMLYLLRPTDIPVGFWSWLEANTRVVLVLVVDECDQVDAGRLEQHAQRCDGRIRLLTIGLAQEARGALIRPPNHFLLDKLSDESMRELLQQSAATLPGEQVNFIIRLSSGFVKLATAIAAALQRNPQAVQTTPQLSSATDITKHSEVREVLHKFLLPKDVDFKAMQAAALLSRIGWERELAQEGKAVCDFLGINWQDAERSIHRQVNEGLVSLQGRYRYVTPHLLAVWLAAEAWETHSSLIDLLAVLPTWNSRRAFLERLRDLGDNDSAQQVAETLLGPNGIFPDLDSINEGTRSEVFALLAEAHPYAGLRALQRILEYLPRDELLRFDAGRFYIVSVLAKMAWKTETFFDAARLLLLLAETENQKWAENARRTWLTLFQTHLGGTTVPAINRHILIAEALNSPSLERQMLAIRAIDMALSVQESRVAGTELQGGRLVPPEWRPDTHQADREVRLSALALLDQCLIHSNPQIRQMAEDLLFNNARQLVALGLADPLLDRMEALPVENDDKRHKLREELETIEEWDVEYLTPQQQERIRASCMRLISNSFHDRLRRWVGKWTTVDWQIGRENPSQNAVQNINTLVDEVMEQPELLRPDIAWLFSDEANNSMLFVRQLGYVDAAHVWWSEFGNRLDEKFGHSLAAAYLEGQVNAGRREWRNTVLDQWMEDGQKSEAILTVIWRGSPDDQDLLRLIQLMREGSLAPERLHLLVWGGQTKVFSAASFSLMVDCILECPTKATVIAAIGLLQQRLDFYPDETKALEDAAWNALERCGFPFDDTTAEYDWNKLAQQYVVTDPVRIARLLLTQFEIESQNNYIRTSQRMDTFNKATRIAPAEVWAEVAPYLLKRDRFGILLRLSLQGWYANIVDVDILLDWAKQHLPDGPRIVAGLAPVGSVPLNSLARNLLILFGNDEAVAAALYATFETDSWSGPDSAYYQSHLDIAREWLKDPHPAVRKWAQIEVNSLESRLAQAKLQEIEAVA